jgi:hypothetical protein
MSAKNTHLVGRAFAAAEELRQTLLGFRETTSATWLIRHRKNDTGGTKKNSTHLLTC